MNKRYSVGLIAAALVAAAPSSAQLIAQDYLKVTIAGPANTPPGKPFDLQLKLAVEPGFHIQADSAKPPYIPTTVALSLPKGFKAAKPVFPKPITATVAGETLPVFEGNVKATVRITPLPKASGPQKIGVKVGYQACNEESCFPPNEAKTTGFVVLGAGKAPAQAIAPTGARPEEPAPAPPSGKGVEGFSMAKIAQFVPPGEFIRFLETGSIREDAGAGQLGDLLKSGRFFVALPLIFVLGLALNLTPCVYPIIPITIGYFGSQTEGGASPLRLSIFYVLGMALMYSALGVFAGLTGSLFGSWLQNPWVLAGFAALMFALALSQFDRKDGRPIWEFQLPASLRNRAQTRSGAGGALFMGLMVGVVAAPCIGPAVIALLQFVGTQKSPALGFTVFFTLALGLGLPYVFLATASGSVKKLPRSGEWMIGVKHVFGAIMVWMGFYYLGNVLQLLHPSAGKVSLVAVTALLGVYLLVDRSGTKARFFVQARRAIGVGGLALAAWIARPAPAETIVWAKYSGDALAKARQEGKKVLIDFTADWCAQCKELEHNTFSDKTVGAAANDFVALRADMTNFNGPEGRMWQAQYDIKGLPTVVRLVPEG